MSARRRVDWPLILRSDEPRPAVRGGGSRAGTAKLAAAFQELSTFADDADQLLRRTVELARELVGVKRAGIFLLDPGSKLLLGTWGTDLNGRTVDEHHVMCEWSDVSVDVVRRAVDEGAPWTVIENSPLVEQLERETRVAGRSWLCCTPLLSGRRPLGMLFNDPGQSGAPVDEEQQRLLAILGAFVAVLLEHPHAGTGPVRFRRTSDLVAAVLRELEDAPSLSGAKLARKHGISVSRLARAFKHEMGMSIVEHRNRLRIQRFFQLVDSGQRLLPAALEAGFGSYAQFHRVFKSQHRRSPVEYLGLRERKRAQPSAR